MKLWRRSPSNVTMESSAAFAILIAAAVLAASPLMATATTPLHIAVLLPLTSVPGWLSSLSHQCLVAIEMAVEDINNRSDLLADYQLNIVANDTKGSQGIALNLLYDHLYSPPTKIAVFGEIMSSITEPTAEVSGLWNVLQFAFATSSMSLSDRSTYPYFFRTTTSAADMNPAVRDIMRQFGWYRVATLHHAVEPHSGVTNHLLSVLQSTNITVESAESFSGNPSDALQRLKAKDVRIVVVNVYESTARQIFCQAYKLKMFGEKYAWFLPGYYSLEWWRRGGPEINCTVAEMEEAIEGYMTVTFSMNSLDDDVTVSGKTPTEFRSEARALLGVDVDLGQSPAANAYDSTWATAFALNDSLPVIAPKTLDTFEYFDGDVADVFVEKMEALSFKGVSGHISFKGADRQGPFLIEQWRDGQELVIGVYDREKPILWYLNEAEIWESKGGRPPYDSDKTVTISIPKIIRQATVYAVTCVSGLAIVISTTFLVFNVRYRREKFVKMSSPNLNNVIIAGNILVCVFVILMGIDSGVVNNDAYLAISKAKVWAITIGFTLAFGSMFAKTWRVYSILIHEKTKKKSIKDRHLGIMVSVMLLIDVIILTVREVVDPMMVREIRVAQPQTNEDVVALVRYEHLYVECYSKLGVVWLAVLTAYKGLMLIFGSFLSWQTRNISVEGLNDSKQIALSIYNVVICCVITLPLSLLIKSDLGISYAMTGGFILFSTVVTLCMLFVPKISAVFRKTNTIATEETQHNFKFNTTTNAASTTNEPSATKSTMISHH